MSLYAKRRSSLRQSLAKVLQRKSLLLSRARKLKGRYLFRAAVRLVLEYMEWITEEPVVEEISDDITINIRMAKQKKVEKKALNLEDRSVLLMDPSERSTADKEYILNLIQKFRAFKKYSEDLRESLAAVCRYQYLQPNRVIVRQDHKAENLYFIVNGEVSLSRIAKDELTDSTKEIDMGTMQPGDMFGEIALLHIIPRTATVITKTAVDLFLITREDFDAILRCTLTDEWDVLQDALVHFNYFKDWDVKTIRECCILSKLKDFKANEILLGDGKGMVNYVHFILEGECRVIEHMLMHERFVNGKTQYELLNPEVTTFNEEHRHTKMLRKTEISEDILRKSEYNDAEVDGTSGSQTEEKETINYAQVLLSSRPAGKNIDVERASIITTTLFDIVNEWHEITDVAAMLMREPSITSQKDYPTDVRTIFIHICMFFRGACFGLGEQMLNRRIVSVTPVRCFLIPRYWLFKHNHANIWERVKSFMNSKYPTREQLFQKFINNRRWMKYKQNLVKDIIEKGRRIPNNTTIHDVPYSIRITEDIDVPL